MRLLRQRRVLTLWGAQSLSVFGDRLYAMAIMWIVWQESGAAAMGLVAIAESVPYIVLGTVGRRVVARFATLRSLAAVDVGRALLVAALPLAWEAVGVPGMLACAVLLGVFGALFDPNFGALVPELVDERDVQAVVGLMDLTGRIARIAGPGAAGLLLAVVPQRSLFWFDGLTFLASAVALLALASRTVLPALDRQESGPAGERPRARVLLRARPDTAVAIGVHGAGIFAHAVALVLPAFLAARLDAGAAAYGAALAATGAGALVANGFAGNLRLPENRTAFYCGLWAASGCVLASVALVGSLPGLLVVSALLGVVNPFLQVALSTHLAAFPRPARLRLMSVDLTVIRTAGTASMLVIPGLAEKNPVAAFALSGVALVVVAGAGAVLLVRRGAGAPDEEPAKVLVRD
ncbi:MFS transporter [Streptomyces griseus]|uniref:MFS transporter n=1 Tax=Streptomyces griseus TaxID=1911 RepID=UPI00256FE616|nr:MFS transporter [Streptomyces fimicarius]